MTKNKRIKTLGTPTKFLFDQFEKAFSYFSTYSSLMVFYVNKCIFCDLVVDQSNVSK